MNSTNTSPIYVDTFKREFVFNDHVCVEMLMGVPDEKRIGRLVQVRKGVGAFGSDIYLIRIRDGGLMTYENVMIRHANDKKFEDSFYRFNGKNPPIIIEQSKHEGDSESAIYSIQGQFYETGFIIENPKQPESQTQSFGMMVAKSRDVTLML